MSLRLLETVHDEASFEALMDNAPNVRSVLDALSSTFGMPRLTAPARGSTIVGCSEHEVIKLMPPQDRALHETERAALQALHGTLPTPTPELVDHGELHGWSWIRMTRLRGEELAELWPHLTAAQHLSLSTQLGETIAALHRLEAPAAVPRLDWSAWCKDRLGTIATRQQSKGCAPAFAEALQASASDVHPGSVAWLHTEIMRAHLLVERTPTGVRLSGLFDFEPSWVAPVDYEFASVGLFFSRGDARLLSEVMRAAQVDISPQRLLTMTLLHRYSNIAWYRRELGGPQDPVALARHWFSR